MAETTNDLSPAVPRSIPGPSGLPLVGSILELRSKGLLQFYQDAWQEHGDVARFELGPITSYQFVRPEHIQHILVKNQANYIKAFSHEKLRVPLGMGILTNEGESWRQQRRLMAPTFTPKAVTEYADLMLAETDRMLERWQARPAGEPLAINPEMIRLTMSIISRSMFDMDIGEEFAEVGQALTFILDFSNKRTISLIDPPLWLPTPLNQGLRRALQILDGFLYGIIDQRRRQAVAGDDLLSRLMEARDPETGQTMSDEQLRDEMLIIFFAGHETTATLLTWTWTLLAQHPEVEEALYDELERVLGGRSPGLDDLEALPYTRMVLDEALRLYPPVAITARDAVADDEIDGYRIEAGSMVSLNPYLTQRHPEFWEKPGAFYPEHFTSERVEARPRYAYFPFGAGPRICLGKHFALLEAMLALSEVAQRTRLRLVPGQSLEPIWSGTLRPEGDILMTIQTRE
jgi:cytochrome P450